MKNVLVIALYASVSVSLQQILSCEAYVPGDRLRLDNSFQRKSILSVSAASQDISPPLVSSQQPDNEGLEGSRDGISLTLRTISNLLYRELINELSARGHPTDGTTAQLRTRLRQVLFPGQEEECIINEDDMDDDCNQAEMDKIMTYQDNNDPFQDLLDEIKEKTSKGHWKAATRKLKKLTRRDGGRAIPEETYLQVLDSCMENRLQGARASEPARKVMERLVEQGYYIPEEVGNFCITNSLGESGPHSTHQGFGGVDTALAMKSAMEASGTPIYPDTNNRLVLALAKEGSVSLACDVLRTAVIEKSETPPLTTFTAVAQTAAFSKINKDAEQVLTVLSYAKAAGYDLDNVAALSEGRTMLACGVIAADRLNNDALGFRLLTAAGNAAGVAPDRGDTMVALSSSAAQRACTLIHKRAINKAVEEGEWKLAVKVLELMLLRGLRPSAWVLRNVVTCCAKAGKSRKATALLIDWLKLSEQGKTEKPPLTVFNTVINACEICNEQELTLRVLDLMKSTHDTDGNLITFNIALKRLAKLGNFLACEGIILGMLKSNVEPSVVTYTTAIASCAFKGNKQSKVAYEWLKRMRSRGVKPNVVTYNTALAACLDGTLASSITASNIAAEMLQDVDLQLQEFDADLDEYRNVIPDSQSKVMARQLMQQLKQNWEEKEIDKRVATDTLRVPLLKLTDFQKSEAAEQARQQAANRKKEEDQSAATQKMEVELEAMASHRSAEV